MAIRTLPSRAIADASIQAVDIASNSISKSKIDADTRLGLQNDSIILDGTDGAGANKGDFLTLNGTDNSSTNADDRVLFDETFVDKLGLFNINTLGSGGQALKVATNGGLEFGTAGGILQVIQNFDDQYATYSNTSPDAQATVLSQAITPSSTSSKILIQVNLCVSCGNSGNKHYGLVLFRGSTEIGSGDKSSWNTNVNETHSAVDMDNYTQPDRILTGMFLDSPNTTSATTYNIKSYIYDYGSSVTAKNLIVNGGGYAYNNQETAVTSSSLTLMEVSG